MREHHMLSWQAQPIPIIGLSPMADMTDLPFCVVVRTVNGATSHMPVMFREMVSSEAVVRENAKTMEMARFDEIERPLIQQIFGADPEVMGRAAAMIMERWNPDGIDINMGCPVYKLTSHFNGAALMKEPERAQKIVRAVRQAIGSSTPLSIKIRLGWSLPTEAREFAKTLEESGADCITVHGRTKTQGYTGVADWNEIGEIKKGVSIPVLANGDVVDGSSAQRALTQSNANGVMIARGALGNPWVFQEIAQQLRHHGQDHDQVDSGPPPWRGRQARMTTTLTEKISVILEHARLMQVHYGDHGIVLFRKHIVWYFKRLGATKAFRQELMGIQTLEELQSRISSLPSTLVALE